MRSRFGSPPIGPQIALSFVRFLTISHSWCAGVALRCSPYPGTKRINSSKLLSGVFMIKQAALRLNSAHMLCKALLLAGFRGAAPDFAVENY
jgi:hypothetical protein